MKTMSEAFCILLLSLSSLMMTGCKPKFTFLTLIHNLTNTPVELCPLNHEICRTILPGEKMGSGNWDDKKDKDIDFKEWIEEWQIQICGKFVRLNEIRLPVKKEVDWWGGFNHLYHYPFTRRL